MKGALVTIVMTLFALTPQARAAESDARFNACKVKLQKANELGVLRDFDWKPPREPYVVAGPTFFSIAIDAKEGFAETLNCFLMAGEEGECVNFDILHWQTGKPVGRFKNCRFKMI